MPSLYLKNCLQLWKANSSINNFKVRKRKLALFCSKKKLSTLLRGIEYHGDYIIIIIDVIISLLFELSSFF